MTPPGRLTIAEAVPFLLALPAPVLLPDTCAMLDVVRAPARNMNYLIGLAEQFAGMATATPKALHVVISETVTLEWREHLPAATAEVERYLQSSQDTLRSLQEACAAFRLPPPADLPAELAELPARLEATATRLFDSALVLSLDGDCLTRAYTRQAHHRRPGRRGKAINDCVIFEHAFCLSAALQSAGFTETRTFVSPNTSDYCEGRALHPELRPEFASAGLEFVTDLRGARHRLRL